MSFSDRQIHNLFKIAKIIYTSPEPTELCALLATQVCPEGELAKVYLAKLDQDGFLGVLHRLAIRKNREFTNIKWVWSGAFHWRMLTCVLK